MSEQPRSLIVSSAFMTAVLLVGIPGVHPASTVFVALMLGVGMFGLLGLGTQSLARVVGIGSVHLAAAVVLAVIT